MKVLPSVFLDIQIFKFWVVVSSLHISLLVVRVLFMSRESLKFRKQCIVKKKKNVVVSFSFTVHIKDCGNENKKNGL